MARRFLMEDGCEVLVLSAEEGMIEHMARGECVIGVLSDINPPAHMTGCYLVEDESQVTMDFASKVYERFRHTPWTIGVGEHVTIRELCSADYDALFSLEREYSLEILKDDLVRSVNSILGYEDEKTYNEEEGRDRLRTYIQQQYPFYEIGIWGVIENATGCLVGICGFTDHEDFGYLLGYHIKKAYRKKQYATEAVKLAMEYAISWHEMEKITCLIHEENEPSKKVAENAGLKYYRTVYETTKKGENLSFLQYQMVCSKKEGITKKMVRWLLKLLKN